MTDCTIELPREQDLRCHKCQSAMRILERYTTPKGVEAGCSAYGTRIWSLIR